MAFRTNEFRQRMAAGGARTNHFDVLFTFPEIVNIGPLASQLAKYRTKAAQSPSRTINPIEVYHFGRSVNIQGDADYEDWTATFLEDEDFSVHSAFEVWSDAITRLDHDASSTRLAEAALETNLVADITVRQYSRNSLILKQWVLKNAWPTNIAPIQYSQEQNSEIVEYDVTFSYDYFIPSGPDVLGSIGESVIST